MQAGLSRSVRRRPLPARGGRLRITSPETWFPGRSIRRSTRTACSEGVKKSPSLSFRAKEHLPRRFGQPRGPPGGVRWR
jgi:hypothetical protein